ncbi:Protein of unknown function [Gryllus bimaculatus]|nr:Protein of unknown function [Gryllus bimaculatus]
MNTVKYSNLTPLLKTNKNIVLMGSKRKWLGHQNGMLETNFQCIQIIKSTFNSLSYVLIKKMTTKEHFQAMGRRSKFCGSQISSITRNKLYIVSDYSKTYHLIVIRFISSIKIYRNVRYKRSKLLICDFQKEQYPPETIITNQTVFGHDSTSKLFYLFKIIHFYEIVCNASRKSYMINVTLVSDVYKF